MHLLASLHARDVDPTAPIHDYDAYKPRNAGRAIIADGRRIALLHVSAHHYYMLPGGGVENEDLATGLTREIQEELGCMVDIGNKIGAIEIYNDRWQTRQIDHCYLARKLNDSGANAPTLFEQEEGHEVVWADSLREAIRLVSEAVPENIDGKLIRARDLLFLRAARDKQA